MRQELGGETPHERHACSPDAQLLIDATLAHEHIQPVLVRVRVIMSRGHAQRRS